MILLILSLLNAIGDLCSFVFQQIKRIEQISCSRLKNALNLLNLPTDFVARLPWDVRVRDTGRVGENKKPQTRARPRLENDENG
ncbi:MAG TPA: hypothetical protein PLJ78_08295 [Anaerolineae bacterium]|nr:hypothetical protein [Anaerolineae bacterium]HQK13925.1 hypothetical protein [Anaerolineae bacterium]